MKKNIYLFIILSVFFVASPVLAGVGVGVNLGKIEIDDPLSPGGIYRFPSIGVSNTGDEPGEYELEITYHEGQPELLPPQEWFRFSPSSFHLEPGESQSVEVTLALPVTLRPGDYFAYLEAHPVVKTGPGTTIGVAAATKTYFTVAPANIFQALYWRAASFMTVYAPWTYVVLAITGGAVALAIVRRFFVFQIGIKKKV